MSTPTISQLTEFTRTFSSIAEKRGLGQRDIATVSGINESQISRLLSGKQGASASTIAAILDVFDGADQRELVIAYLRDTIRTLNLRPENYPIAGPREPSLADIAGQNVAQLVISLLERSRENPGILQGLEALDQISSPKAANIARRVHLSRTILPTRKTTPRRKVATGP